MVPSTACDRARTWASLRLDGELSEFERVLLDAHLERCDECRRSVALYAAATEAIRTTPMRRPAHRPETTFRRPRSTSAFRLLATAIVAVVMFTIVGGSVGAARLVLRKDTPKTLRTVGIADGHINDSLLLANNYVPRPRPLLGHIVWPA